MSESLEKQERRMKMSTDQEWKDLQAAQWVAESLFVNGQGDQADRLVLTSADGRNLGGWCRRAVVDRIMQNLQEARQAAPPEHPTVPAPKGEEGK